MLRFLIKENHWGVHLYLPYKKGQTSKPIAVTKFTDGQAKFSTAGLPG
jgi:hypothetical protein